jgi:hypothetical protein
MDSFRLESRLGGEAPQDQEDAGARQPAASRVEKELGTVARVEERAPAAQVTAKRLGCLPADRHHALL